MKLGDHNAGVRAWQQALVARGAKLVVDGVFGTATHNATLAFQAAHGLDLTGEAAMNELQVVAAPPQGTTLRPPPLLAHSIPLIEAKFYLRVPRTPRQVVLHCMEAAETSTTAERCAQYLATLPDDVPKKSTHYCVDSDTVIQGVPDHMIAYHAPGLNQTGIGIEHAGYARQTREEWLDAFGQRMLGLSVQLCARLCLQWKIPATFARAADLQLGRPGITTHREVTAAFGKSTHSDPGPNFPIAWYVERVAALLADQQQGTV